MWSFLEYTTLTLKRCANGRVRLHIRVVGTCFAKLETGHTFSYVKTDATTPNQMLGVIVSVIVYVDQFFHNCRCSIQHSSVYMAARKSPESCPFGVC